MPELRWTLLILGVIFIAVLAWWERRKPHQASRQTPHIGESTRLPPAITEPAWESELQPANPRAARDPTLTLPEMRADLRPDSRPEFAPDFRPEFRVGDRTEGPAGSRHDPLTGDAPMGARSDALGGVGRPEGPTASRPDGLTGAGRPGAPTAGARPDTSTGSRPLLRPDTSTGSRPVLRPEARPPDPRGRERPRELPIVEIPDDSLAGMHVDDDDPVEDEFADEEIEADEPELPEEALVPLVAGEPMVTTENTELPAPPTTTVPPILDWPPEEQRKVVALRLVARPPERFQGRLVRQALAAEGFVLGELDIFHKPDAQNRAVLSAASLTKPGTFDYETMDTQRYVGLNLFAVLPGPRTPQKAFEDLLLTARMLNERLEGGLQDERGNPLTPMRIQAIRDGLGAEAKS